MSPRRQLLGFRADRLLDARSALGWSQGEVAVKATAALRLAAGLDPGDDSGPQISTAAISSWERGKFTPTVSNLAAVAKVLGVALTYLIDIPADEHTLRTLRELDGRTQPVLAAAAGISSGLLASLERGHASLTDEVAAKLSRALDVPIDDVRTAHRRGRRR